MRTQFGHARVQIIALFGLGVVFSLAFQLGLPNHFYDGSSSDYAVRDLPVARAVLTGYVITADAKIPAIGFPLILAALLQVEARAGIPLEWSVRALAVGCMGLTTVLLFLISRLIWKSNWAWLTAVLWVSYPFVLWLSGQNSTELPFLVLFLMAVWLFGLAVSDSNPYVCLALSGLCLGGAMLVRPGAFALPVLFGIAWGLGNKRTRWHSSLCAACLLVLCSIGIILPWEGFIWQQTGRYVLISTSDIASIRDGMTFGAITKGYRMALPLPSEAEAFMADAAAQRDRLNTTNDIALFLIQQIQNRPNGVLQWLSVKLLRAWYGTDSQRYDMLVLAFQLIYLAFGLIGMIQAWRRKVLARPMLFVLYGSLLYFWLVTIIVLPILRYMIPAMAILFVFSPGIFAPTRKSLKSKHHDNLSEHLVTDIQ